MNFLTPVAFALGLLLPLIILLYLLKLRRIERPVSSTYLWRRMVRDLEANAPWQRLQRNLLLLLQLLFLIALIFSLSRPFIWSEGFDGQAAILILDTSASMAASDVPPNRLEAAKQQINRLVESLPQDVRITVISAGSQARVLVAASLDRRQVLQTIQNLTFSPSGSDLRTALQLASAIASRQPQTEIIVFSDGGVTLPPRLSVNGHLRFIPIGSSGENQAISLLKLEPSSGEEYITAFVQMVNHGESSVQRRLAITVDGSLFNAYDVSIPAQKEKSLLVENIPPSAQTVEAHLLADSNSQDYLVLDDRAYAVVRQQAPVSVNLVSQGNRFLETALALLPGIQVIRTDPAGSGSLPQVDITVLDATLPLTATLPSGNLFFIAPVHSTEFFSVTGTIQNPLPIPADDSPDLLKFISLESVNILDAVEIPLPEYAQPVIMSEQHGSEVQKPLLFVGETGGRRLVVLAFSLQHSDLPLQIAFPILTANLIQWLAPGQLGIAPTQVNSGETVAFQLPFESKPPGDRQSIQVTMPDGQIVQLEAREGQIVFSGTSQIGVYTVIVNEETQLKFAVNFFLPDESNLKPKTELSISSIGADSASEAPLRSRQEWWRFFAMAALTLLSVEWLVYQRPTLVFLAKKIR